MLKLKLEHFYYNFFWFSEAEEDSESGSDSDSEMDLDLTVDIMALSTDAQADINEVGKGYDLGKSDFIKFLARDIEEAQELRNVKQQEEEKSMFSVGLVGCCFKKWKTLFSKENVN